MSYLQHQSPIAANMAAIFASATNYDHEGVVMKSTTLTPRHQEIVDEIERMVLDGRQREISDFFREWVTVPPSIGEWELRTNFKRLDGAVAGRTVVATPLTVRTRAIFQAGSLKTLIDKGFTPEDARRYYKAAWKRQYVWVETVLTAVGEMLTAFRTSEVPRSYLQTADPRRLASSVKVPQNPWVVGHFHFIVAAEMAVAVIDQRIKDENKEQLKQARLQAQAASSEPAAV